MPDRWAIRSPDPGGQRARTLYVYDNEPPDPALYPSAGVLTSRAEALRSALAETGTTISTLSHWSKPEAALLDLTIGVRSAGA